MRPHGSPVQDSLCEAIRLLESRDGSPGRIQPVQTRYGSDYGTDHMQTGNFSWELAESAVIAESKEFSKKRFQPVQTRELAV